MIRSVKANETSHLRHRTREQARELLEALRSAYQSLSPASRVLVKSVIADSRPIESTQQHEEKECFALAR